MPEISLGIDGTMVAHSTPRREIVRYVCVAMDGAMLAAECVAAGAQYRWGGSYWTITKIEPLMYGPMSAELRLVRFDTE